MVEIDIVSPSKKLVVGTKAGSVKFPTLKGEIEVLAGHAELLTLLHTGVLSFSVDGRERQFAISHGFAEVRNDKVIVLAETIEEASDVDRERAALAQKKAENILSGVLDEQQFRKYQLKLQRAVIRQSISE